VDVFKLCWRDVAELAEQATVVEPVDPFEGGEFEVVEAPPTEAPEPEAAEASEEAPEPAPKPRRRRRAAPKDTEAETSA